MNPTPIADMIAEMHASGIQLEMIIVAVRSMERAMSTRQGVDETAEKRRAWDREYRRNKRGHPPDPPDVHPKPPDVGDIALTSLSEIKKHTEVVIKKEKKEKKERGCKCPPDWKPNQHHYDEGEKLGMNRAAVDARAVAMRTWCEANANRSVTTKANWDAAFTGTWLKDSRNGQYATSNNRTATTAGSTQTGADSILAGMGRLAARNAERKLAERSSDREGEPGFDLADESLPHRH